MAGDRTGPRTIPPGAQPVPPPGHPDGDYPPARSRGETDPGKGPRRRSRAREAGARPAPGEDSGRGRSRDAGQEEPAAARSKGRGRGTGRTPRTGKSKRRARLLIWGGAGVAVAVIVIVVAALSFLGPAGPRHTLTTPDAIGQFVRRPQLEQQMNAAQLQRQVIARSAGQASHVVSAVYENSAGISGKSTPQIFLFIGGNLSGTSAGDFIASFRSQFQGATITNAGTLGGEAVCVNAQSGVPGTVALCAWADDDTFGVLASPTMHAAQLGPEMRLMRPGVEHVVK